MRSEKIATLQKENTINFDEKSTFYLQSTMRRRSLLQQQEKIIDIFDIKNVRDLLKKDKKSPTDLINLNSSLKSFSFFEDCKKTLTFSNYVSLLRSLEYSFFQKGEVVYSIGDASTDMYVVLEGSFFALIRDLANAKEVQTLEQAVDEENKSLINKGDQFQNRILKAQELINNQELALQFKKIKEKLEQQNQGKHNEPLEWFEVTEWIEGMVLVEVSKIGSNFGEYELVYGQRRSQVLMAREDSHVIKISKQIYQLLPKEKKKKNYSTAMEFIYQFDFFHSWGRQWVNLLSCFETIECCLNQVIFSEKEEPEYIYFVQEGDFEISKKIEVFEEENKRALEFANIPLYSYKKFVKQICKVPGEPSERIRICICGSNSYFGDEEVLTLSLRKSSAICVSLKGILYRLSMKNLVKVVCVQNNIWGDMQARLQQKLQWQRSLFIEELKIHSIEQEDKSLDSIQNSARNEYQSDIEKVKNNNSIQQQRKRQLFSSNLSKKNSIPIYAYSPEYLKRNENNNLQKTCKEVSENIGILLKLNQKSENKSLLHKKSLPEKVDLQKKKNESPQNRSSKPKSERPPSITPYLKGMGSQFVSTLSPVQTSKYFNIKQELLNKRFFPPRTKNLIEIQQNVYLAKRSRNSSLSNSLNMQNLDSRLAQDNENQLLSQKVDNLLNEGGGRVFISEIFNADPNHKKSNTTISHPSKAMYSPPTSPRIIPLKNDINNKLRALTVDVQSICNAEEDENQETVRSRKQLAALKKCVRKGKEEKEDEFEKFLEGGKEQEKKILTKKYIWKEMKSNQEQITRHGFFEKLLKAISIPKQDGCKSEDLIAFENKIRQQNKLKYSNFNKKKDKDKNADNNCVDESPSNRNNQTYDNNEAITEFKQQIGGNEYSISFEDSQISNRFAQFYAKNKDKRSILKKFQFNRLMLPSVGDSTLGQIRIEINQKEEIDNLSKFNSIGGNDSKSRNLKSGMKENGKIKNIYCQQIEQNYCPQIINLKNILSFPQTSTQISQKFQLSQKEVKKSNVYSVSPKRCESNLPYFLNKNTPSTLSRSYQLSPSESNKYQSISMESPTLEFTQINHMPLN